MHFLLSCPQTDALADKQMNWWWCQCWISIADAYDDADADAEQMSRWTVANADADTFADVDADAEQMSRLTYKHMNWY